MFFVIVLLLWKKFSIKLVLVGKKFRKGISNKYVINFGVIYLNIYIIFVVIYIIGEKGLFLVLEKLGV